MTLLASRNFMILDVDCYFDAYCDFFRWVFSHRLQYQQEMSDLLLMFDLGKVLSYAVENLQAYLPSLASLGAETQKYLGSVVPWKQLLEISKVA